MPNETLAPQNTILSSKTLGKTLQNREHQVGPFDHLRAVGVWNKGGTTGHHTATRAGQGGAPPPDEANREISRPTDAGHAGIWPENTTAAAPVCHRTFRFSGHFRPPHTSLPPFLDPLDSFPLSLFADSSPFESYDENKVSRRLD